MEKKNMVLLTVIAVATLLVAVVGATFAYFTATVTDSRDSGSGPGEGASGRDRHQAGERRSGCAGSNRFRGGRGEAGLIDVISGQRERPVRRKIE